MLETMIQKSQLRDEYKEDVYRTIDAVDFKASDVITLDPVTEEKISTPNDFLDIGDKRIDNVMAFTGMATDNEKMMHMTNLAQKRFYTFLGIPHNFMMKCPAELREINVKHFQKEYEGVNCLFRTYKPGVDLSVLTNNLIVPSDKHNILRSVHSEKYGFIDDTDVLRAVNDVLSTGIMDDPQIRRAYHADNHMRLMITDGTPILNDNLLCLIIGNSELGEGAVKMQLGIYTLRCENGMALERFSAMFRRKHIGQVSIEELKIYANSVIGQLRNNKNSITNTLAKAIETTVEKDKFGLYLNSLKHFPKHWRDDMHKRIEPRPSKIDVWSAVSDMTETAQKCPEKIRESIETEAGNFMDKNVN